MDDFAHYCRTHKPTDETVHEFIHGQGVLLNLLFRCQGPVNGKHKVIIMCVRHLLWDRVNTLVLEIHFDRHPAAQINCKILVWIRKTFVSPTILRKVVHCLPLRGKKI